MPARKQNPRVSARKKSPAKSGTKSGSSRGARAVACPDCGLKGRHAPDCSDAFTPSPESELPIEIVEGGRYWSVDDAELLVKRIAGDVVHYTIDDGENVFSEKRARFREIVERRIEDAPAPTQAAAGPREVKTTVDGKDAAIVIDGVTGKLLSPGGQATLVQVPIEELVHQLVKHDVLIAELASARGSISNQLKTAKERREEIIAEIKHRDPSSPSLFTLSPSEPDVEDDEEDDE